MTLCDWPPRPTFKGVPQERHRLRHDAQLEQLALCGAPAQRRQLLPTDQLGLAAAAAAAAVAARRCRGLDGACASATRCRGAGALGGRRAHRRGGFRHAATLAARGFVGGEVRHLVLPAALERGLAAGAPHQPVAGDVALGQPAHALAFAAQRGQGGAR